MHRVAFTQRSVDTLFGSLKLRNALWSVIVALQNHAKKPQTES